MIKRKFSIFQRYDITKKSATQTVLFDKEKWTVSAAKTWLNEHDYKSSAMRETEDKYRFEQVPAGNFSRIYETRDIGRGIQLVNGILKSSTKKYDLGLAKVKISKPEIKPGETEEQWMGRCIPFMVNEGREQKQAIAMCGSMWREKSSEFNKFMEFVLTDEYNSPGDVAFGDVIIEKGRELRLVTGIVLEPETVDSQGDIYSEDEIRKTAHEFMVDYTGQGNKLMHKTYESGLMLVESYITPVEIAVNEHKVKKGTWVMSTLVLNDKIWKAIKEKKITGYSIGGISNARSET